MKHIMMKAIMIAAGAVLLTFIMVALYYRFRPEPTRQIKSHFIINELRTRSVLNVLEVETSNLIEMEFARTFWDNFKVHYFMKGFIRYGVDLSELDSTNVIYNEGSNVITIGLPPSTPMCVELDHKSSYIINPTWRLGVNEFEIADSVYRYAYNCLAERANTRELLNKADAAAIESVRQLLKKIYSNYEFEVITLKIYE